MAQLDFQKFNLQKLQTRSVSAAILIPATLLILYFGGWPFIALLVGLAGISLYEAVQLCLKTEGRCRYLYFGASIPYVLLSFVCCYYIFETLGFYWAMAFLFMVWGSDTGAYVFGKSFGGPKMAEAISPNKTWAGFGGALLTPFILGVIAVFLFKGVDGFTLKTAIEVAGIGLCVGIAGQGGDLLVSSLKRRADVKDTGHLIPGHGGLLDRIDSMLLAAPVFLFLMAMISHGF